MFLSGDQIQQCRLACPDRADDDRDGAGLEHQIYPTEQRPPGPLHGDVAKFDPQCRAVRGQLGRPDLHGGLGIEHLVETFASGLGHRQQGEESTDHAERNGDRDQQIDHADQGTDAEAAVLDPRERPRPAPRAPRPSAAVRATDRTPSWSPPYAGRRGATAPRPGADADPRRRPARGCVRPDLPPSIDSCTIAPSAPRAACPSRAPGSQLPSIHDVESEHPHDQGQADQSEDRIVQEEIGHREQEHEHHAGGEIRVLHR